MGGVCARRSAPRRHEDRAVEPDTHGPARDAPGPETVSSAPAVGETLVSVSVGVGSAARATATNGPATSTGSVAVAAVVTLDG